MPLLQIMNKVNSLMLKFLMVILLIDVVAV